MNKDQFEQILRERMRRIEYLLITKAKEYANDENRMHNFYRAAAISGEHPVKVLDGFLLKHITSYYDIVNKISNGGKITKEMLDEKIGDILTYFFLQEALMIDTDSISNLSLKKSVNETQS